MHKTLGIPVRKMTNGKSSFLVLQSRCKRITVLIGSSNGRPYTLKIMYSVYGFIIGNITTHICSIKYRALMITRSTSEFTSKIQKRMHVHPSKFIL